jgi:AraC-like DNA-binding protein
MAVVCYREYRPCAPLRDSVRAFFSFVAPDANDAPRGARMREVLFEAGDSFCSPLFADGHASIVFSFPRACRADGVWHASATAPRAHLIGPMTMVGSSSLEERPEMLGAYLRASAATRITGVSAAELTDRIIPLEDLWGPSACSLAANLSEMNEAARLDHLESVLFQSITHAPSSPVNLDIPGLTALVFQHRGQVSVQHLADAAGTSRQHLTRIFRETVGVSPKLYCRLARFHATLRYRHHGGHTPWAQVAIEMGYADQSHMIAEFRHFSSLTPEMLVTGSWFHPFLERTQAHHRSGTEAHCLPPR